MKSVLSWIDWYYTAPADTAGVVLRLAIAAAFLTWLIVGALFCFVGQMAWEEDGRRPMSRWWWLAVLLGPGAGLLVLVGERLKRLRGGAR